jgi:hypothetical protein
MQIDRAATFGVIATVGVTAIALVTAWLLRAVTADSIGSPEPALLFFGNFAYDMAYFGIMNAANFWEKVMFDLVIESAYIPAEKFVVVGKVGGRFYLVNHPGILDVTLFIFSRMFRSFDNMSQLKNDTQNNTRGEMDD